MQPPTSLYLHIPIQPDTFNEAQANAYLDALRREVDFYAPKCLPLRTIFLGGVPSALSASALSKVFAALHDRFEICPNAEITVECNPGNLEREKLQAMQATGVNRLSISVQAMDDAIHSFRLARDMGFDNINLDLLFAVPDQTVEQWKQILQLAISLDLEHLSTYNFMSEEDAPFYEPCGTETLKTLPNEVEAEMYQLAIEMLTNMGYEQYEISHFAKPGFLSRHQLVYWNNEHYIGVGAGACGYLNGVRYTNIRDVGSYIEYLSAGRKPIAASERLTGRAKKSETIILGLQKRKGISAEAYQSRFGEPIETEFGDVIEKWTRFGLLEWKDKHLQLTVQGLFFADDVFMDFL
jgi:oxygen-independent coproporphyrinogen III oxidase